MMGTRADYIKFPSKRDRERLNRGKQNALVGAKRRETRVIRPPRLLLGSCPVG